jgi:Asp-tRNA(Asn)/Glu-tRNA(Gln) amidotransferase A subunit family amidase
MHLSQDQILICLAALFLGLAVARIVTMPTPHRTPREYRSWKPKDVQTKHQRRPAPNDIGDSAHQLKIVSEAEYRPQKLMSRTEARVFDAAEQALEEIGMPWRVMAQVSLGEILSSSDNLAYRCINSKRVDMLIVSEDQLPIAAIEFQGTGHYLGDAAARDAVKKEALRRAGIGYIEIVAGDMAAEVKNQIRRLIALRRITVPLLQTNPN